MKTYCVRVFLLLSITASARRSDLFTSEFESWLSDDDFRTAVTLSFPFSRCCNVYLSESVELSEVMFDQFRSIYPHVYHLKRSSHECNAFLLLGSNDNEIMRFLSQIRWLQWKTEILIIVNEDVSDDSNIFDEHVYKLANVNILSTSGIWKLSENYLTPRVFVELGRYEEMVHRYDKIDFQGRQLDVCSIYRPPMTYFNHTINKTIDHVQVEVFTIDNDLERDGIEMQLFLIMAEKLNFTWTIMKPRGEYTYGRRVNETEWQGGMIEMLRNGEVDIAFGSIWVISDQYVFIHLSEPWHQVYLHFLVPRPRKTSSFWALSRPFSEDVWGLLVSAIFLHSLYTWTRAWIDPKFPKYFRNFLIALTDLIGYFLSSSTPKVLAHNRLQILLWQTAGWLIITAYCSSLAARLASSEYEPRIDTVEQFLAANLSWGERGQTPPFRDYFDLTDPYSSQLPSRYRNTANNTETEALIKQGNYAIIGKIIDTYFFPEDYVTSEDLKNYRLMKQSVGHFYAAFALQPWLLTPINRILLWMRETGITVWHLRDVIRRRDNYNLREVLVEHDGYDGSVLVLGLTPLGAGFSLLLVGLSIATLVFYLELKRAARSTSVRQILRDIDNRRKPRCKRERYPVAFECR